MPDGSLFIAIVVVAIILVFLLILNIIIQVISIIKEQKGKNEYKQNRSTEIQYKENNDIENSDCLSRDECISTESSKEAEKSFEMDEESK